MLPVVLILVGFLTACTAQPAAAPAPTAEQCQVPQEKIKGLDFSSLSASCGESLDAPLRSWMVQLSMLCCCVASRTGAVNVVHTGTSQGALQCSQCLCALAQTLRGQLAQAGVDVDSVLRSPDPSTALGFFTACRQAHET